MWQILLVKIYNVLNKLSPSFELTVNIDTLKFVWHILNTQWRVNVESSRFVVVKLTPGIF